MQKWCNACYKKSTKETSKKIIQIYINSKEKKYKTFEKFQKSCTNISLIFKNFPVKKVFYILIILAIIVWVIANKYNAIYDFSVPEDTIVFVDSWENFRSILTKIWMDETLTKIYLKLNPPDFQLQKWSYILESGQHIDQIMASLKTPISEDIHVTILEWWNIYDIDAYLTGLWLINAGDFTTRAETDFYDFKYKFSSIADASTLEWYLYPDTYNINPNNFSIDDFITKMLQNFDAKVVSNLWNRYGAFELLDVITMASIVEKEEKNKDEKPVVAGILKKRVQEWWMIGADATVCYPYKLTHKQCTPSFIVNHIDDKNEYNTRTMIWTPITPIANPSWETINATINSKESPYYFYLHDSEGVIHYAITNAEHESNKAKYLY